MKPEGTQVKTFIQLRFSPNRSPTNEHDQLCWHTLAEQKILWIIQMLSLAPTKSDYHEFKKVGWLDCPPPSCFRIIPPSLHCGREQILTIRKVQKSIELAVQEQKEEERQWITNSNNRCSKTWQTLSIRALWGVIGVMNNDRDSCDPLKAWALHVAVVVVGGSLPQESQGSRGPSASVPCALLTEFTGLTWKEIGVALWHFRFVSPHWPRFTDQFPKSIWLGAGKSNTSSAQFSPDFQKRHLPT